MRARVPVLLLAATALAATAGAQFGGGAASYEVSGVTVDVVAKTPDEARYGGWRLAQRKAWAQLSKRLGGGGAPVSDGTLDQLVAGIIVENEQIGPTRYIARLGVLFNRARAASLLGIFDSAQQSAPMLVIPIEQSGGVARAYEAKTEWQAAWARFRTGNSALDYVRPGGTGPDALLLNYGQTQRRARGWWRAILDQYGASDVLAPTVRLTRQWPGGPVVGLFQARHGPDNDLLGEFALRVNTADGVPQLLDAGVKRLDEIYTRALGSGALTRDPALSPPPLPVATPTDAPEDGAGQTVASDEAVTSGGQGIAITLQYDSPSASSVANTESAMRGIAGVRSASTTSLALGGVSLMRVTFDGDPAALRSALEGRGYQVLGSGTTLRIRRAPQLLPPEVPQDDRPAG